MVKKKSSDVNAKKLDAKCMRLADSIFRANQGDKAALRQLKQLLKELPPEMMEVLDGDLTRLAETKLVTKLTGDQLGFREGIYAKLDSLRAELGGNNPMPIERLLVERVITCWLQLAAADIAYYQNDGVSFAQGDYLQRRQERAHRRYLSSLKMLAVVRRMALPIRVDINLADSVETKSAEAASVTRPRWSPIFADN